MSLLRAHSHFRKQNATIVARRRGRDAVSPVQTGDDADESIGKHIDQVMKDVPEDEKCKCPRT